MKRDLPAVGTAVVVAATLYRENDGTHRRWLRDDYAVRRGVVTGYSHRCDGVYHGSTGGGWDGWSDDPPEPEPAYLAITRKHLVILVRFTAWGPEVPCLLADVMPAPKDGWVLPSTRGTGSWSESARAALRRESAVFPRDARGRWAKTGA